MDAHATQSLRCWLKDHRLISLQQAGPRFKNILQKCIPIIFLFAYVLIL